MTKKVSIIIPTFKRSDRVERALISALTQEYENFEVIVVDDNDPLSEERKLTEKVLEKYGNNKLVKYIKHDSNKNGSTARNTGIKNSNGDYITFLDDDDEYYPNKIGVQAESLNKLDSSWAMCYTAYEKIDRYKNLQKSSEQNEGNIEVQVLSKNLYIGSGSNFMVRRENISKVNGFDESFNRNQDLEFMSRILINNKIKYVNEVTFLIHNEVRENKFTYDELVAINENYKDNFAPIINSLSEVKQDKIYRQLSLNEIRDALMSFRVFSAIKIYLKSNLSKSDLINYLHYLFKRYRTKTSYGFRIEGDS